MSPEASDLARARGHVYHFLARFFTHAPEEEFVRNVLSADTLASLAEMFPEEAVAELRHVAQTVSLRGGRGHLTEGPTLLDLVTDYTGLLDAPTRQYLTPYESVYRADSQDGRGRPAAWVYGPSTVAVRRLYEAAGAEIAPEFRDLPDHVGMELEFLAFLCEREAEAWEVGQEEDAATWHDWQRRFLEEHLGVWIDALCEKMQRFARTGFFRAAAGLTAAYVARERVLLKEGDEGE